MSARCTVFGVSSTKFSSIALFCAPLHWLNCKFRSSRKVSRYATFAPAFCHSRKSIGSLSNEWKAREQQLQQFCELSTKCNSCFILWFLPSTFLLNFQSYMDQSAIYLYIPYWVLVLLYTSHYIIYVQLNFLHTAQGYDLSLHNWLRIYK